MRHQARPTSSVTVPAPTTRAELDVLFQRRNELSDQLRQLSERHGQLVGERHNASVNQNQAVVTELDARIAEFSQRISRIEREKLQTDDAIADGISRGLASSDQRPEPIQVVSIPGGGTAIVDTPPLGYPLGGREVVAFGLAVALLGVVAWRWAWRRAEQLRARVLLQESQQTKDLRVAVETIALEVERISEGQRFITKLLAERAEQDPALLERGKSEPR